MKIFFTDNLCSYEHNDKSLTLIKNILKHHMGLQEDRVGAVRSDNGVIKITGTDLYVSVTHKGIMWLCAVDDKPCGIDIEISTYKSNDFEAISRKYFFTEEQKHVYRSGKEGFLDIWTRKEAIAKANEKSVFWALNNINVMNKDGFLDKINGLSLLCFDLTSEIKIATASYNKNGRIEFMEI